MILATSDLTDDAQLIGSFGTLLVAATGFVVAIVKINQANRTAKDTLDHVNGLEAEERIPEDGSAAPRVTLGSEVRAIHDLVASIDQRLRDLEGAVGVQPPRKRPPRARS